MSLRPLKVIFIEDSEPLQHAIADQLAKDPSIEVSCASTAKEGGRLAMLERKVVILADLGLPDAEGTEVLEALKEIIPATPIIVITGHPDLVERAKLAGADAVIVKGSEQSYGEGLIKTIRDAALAHDMKLMAAPAMRAVGRVGSLIEEMQKKGDSVNIQPKQP